MISFAEPLPIGNAVRILLDPPDGATEWRLLRNETGSFSGETDPAAMVIYDGSEDVGITDIKALVNGTAYSYCVFYLIGTDWAVGGDVVVVTPATTYGLGGPDPLTFVRDRLEQGLRAAVAANKLKHENGFIPVQTAPPLFENTKWPVVSVHLQNDAPQERGIGETVVNDEFDPANDVFDVSEGWMSGVTLQIVGWSMNPDERIALRQAIKAIMIGNLPVFDSVGMIQIGFSQSDVEDFENYGAPIYETIGNFSCVAPSILSGVEAPIEDVTVDAEAA